jgi:hypothetical protein
MDSYIHEHTLKLVDQLFPNQSKTDSSVRLLLRHECMRRMAAYRRTDERMQKKYSSTFDEFTASGIVSKRDFTWDVESDAMDWEIAVTGMQTCQGILEELSRTNAA